MSTAFPICCSSEAFALLASQAGRLGDSDALLNGAVAIAMLGSTKVDPDEVDATIQGYADAIRPRVHGRQPQALLAHLHAYLFDELGFKGNSDDYYNRSNSFLPDVLASKRGLPITLSLIYCLVASRIGLRAWGVGLPGHFLVGVDVGGTLLIDPFNHGATLTPEEARGRLVETFGEEVEWSDDLLRPATNRQWLTRMLQNLLNVYGASDDYASVAAVLEMEMLLWPEQRRLQRDLGLVLARCGHVRPASAWLEKYLESNPDDPQLHQLQELVQVLAR